jgi:hypothetical protein
MFASLMFMWIFLPPEQKSQNFIGLMGKRSFEKEGIGVLYASDPKLDTLKPGDLVGFKPGAEYEFIIGKHRVYRVPTNSITIKYEYQGNEEEYNPSWTKSS